MISIINKSLQINIEISIKNVTKIYKTIYHEEFLISNRSLENIYEG